MRLYRKNNRSSYLNILLSVVGFAVIIGIFLFYIGSISTRTDSEAQKLTEETIHKALVNCYAIEGVYPPSLDYLEENYGVMIDHDRFYVEYRVMGSNLTPDVQVLDLSQNAQAQ